MRSLYFDIDGTILAQESGLTKQALERGKLEDGIRAAQIESLICVGNFVKVIYIVQKLQPDYDGLGVIFRLCGGAFRDENWFKRVTTLSRNPENRAAELPLDQDWFYLDDLAEQYLCKADRTDVFGRENGHRVFAPVPGGSGTDVLEWLSGLALRR